MCIVRQQSKIIKIKLDKSKKLWYNSCTKKKTKLEKTTRKEYLTSEECSKTK